MHGIISWEQYLLSSLLILLLYYSAILIGYPGKNSRGLKKKKPSEKKEPDAENELAGKEDRSEEFPPPGKNLRGAHYSLIQDLIKSLNRLMVDAKKRGVSKETLLKEVGETFGEYPETENNTIPSAILHYVRINAGGILGISLDEREIQAVWRDRKVPSG